MRTCLDIILIVTVLCNSVILGFAGNCSTFELGISDEEKPKIICSNAKQETTIIVGCSGKKEPKAVGSSEKQEPKAVGSLEKQETKAVGSLEKQETKAVGASEEQETKAVGTSEKQETKAVGASEEQETKAVGTSEKQETKTVGSSEKQETKTVGSSEKQETKTVGSSEKQETKTVGSSEKQETLVLGSASKQETKDMKLSEKLNYEFPEFRLNNMQNEPAYTQKDKIKNDKSDMLSINEILINKFSTFSPILRDYSRPRLYEDYGKIPFITETLSSIYWKDSAEEFNYYWNSDILNWDEWNDTKKDNYYNISKFKFNNDFNDIINLLGDGFITIPENPCCGRIAAYTEWLLERHGIEANIIIKENFSGGNYSHAWVEVPTNTGERLYIDLSKSPEYMRNDEEYYPKNENQEIKRGYFSFKNIYALVNYYKEGSIPSVSWWSTDWGRRILKRFELINKGIINGNQI